MKKEQSHHKTFIQKSLKNFYKSYKLCAQGEKSQYLPQIIIQLKAYRANKISKILKQEPENKESE